MASAPRNSPRTVDTSPPLSPAPPLSPPVVGTAAAGGTPSPTGFTTGVFPAAEPAAGSSAGKASTAIRLLGILCNWSPFACFNAAAMAHLELPPEYSFMRVMCIGRINQALILRAFEYGADGVILLECRDEDCRYGPGPEVGHSNVDRVRRLLHLLGIGQSRLVEKSFQAHEKEELVRTLWEFAAQIKALGPNPAKPPQERRSA